MKIVNKELVIAGMVPKAFEVYKNEEGLFFVCLSVYLSDSYSERLLSFKELDKFTDLPSFDVVADVVENYAFKSEVVTDEEKWREGDFNMSRRINDGRYKLYSRINFYNVLEAFIVNNPDSVPDSFKRKLVETTGYKNYLDSMKEISFILSDGRNRIYRKSDYDEIMRSIKQQLNREKTIDILMKKCLNARPTLDWAQKVFEYGPAKSGRSFSKREHKIQVKTHLKEQIYAVNN